MNLLSRLESLLSSHPQLIFVVIPPYGLQSISHQYLGRTRPYQILLLVVGNVAKHIKDGNQSWFLSQSLLKMDVSRPNYGNGPFVFGQCWIPGKSSIVGLRSPVNDDEIQGKERKNPKEILRKPFVRIQDFFSSVNSSICRRR